VKKAPGFTLLEVLVALSVAAIVLGAVYGIVTGVSTAKQRLDEDGEGFQQARVLFGRMARELRSAYFIRDQTETLFRGGLDDSRYCYLELTTTVISPTLPLASGISRVRYELSTDADSASTLPRLVRQESPLLPGGEAATMKSGLTAAVHAFILRFYDGNNWQEDWDTAQSGRLPQMIELYLEIQVAGRQLPFLTRVAIPQVQGA